jgi:hypothetical protein
MQINFELYVNSTDQYEAKLVDFSLFRPTRKVRGMIYVELTIPQTVPKTSL